MDKRTEFTAALKTAMKERDQVTISTVRLMLAALKDRDIASRTQGKADAISDAEILGMLQSMIKQRQESADTYSKAGRDELARRELAEISVIESFLPRQLDEAEMKQAVDEVVAATGADDIKAMGKVMAVLRADYAGRMDMAAASALVKQKLAG
ncbi:MAG: GatB/YqeY domain-containing protein [Alphaproteobacteria bacterium]|nr:GatB/YqeY domain-containing protein [Alphaproteobacteria bacterium]